MKELLCREIEGRRVKLTRTLKNGWGHVFLKGRVMKVYGSWRGRFQLETLGRPHRAITRISRRDFEVVS